MDSKHVQTSWWALRIVYGVIPIVAGLDKFTNLLVNWRQYLSPIATQVLPFSPDLFMRIVGVIEIIVGVLVLTRITVYAAYVACAWLVLIAINLLTTGKYFDIAARDVAMAVGAFALGELSQARGYLPHRASDRGELRGSHATS